MNPAAVAAVLAGVDPAPLRLVLYSFGEAFGYGSRARGDAMPDSDLDLLMLMPQPQLTPQERQVALLALRSALRPLRLPAAALDPGPGGENSVWLASGLVLLVAEEDAHHAAAHERRALGVGPEFCHSGVPCSTTWPRWDWHGRQGLLRAVCRWRKHRVSTPEALAAAGKPWGECGAGSRLSSEGGFLAIIPAK